MGVSINGLRTRIDKTLLEDRQQRWMSDSKKSLREFYKTDVILMSGSLLKNLKELKEELIEEVQEMLNIIESMEQKVNGKSSKENILQNEIDRLLEVSLTSDIRNCMLISVEKQKNELLNAELEKSSTTRTQHQKELDELIEHVNQKTHAYADVRAQNQDLLVTISELKNKLQTVDKGKTVNTKFDKSETSRTLLCVTPLPKNIVMDLGARILDLKRRNHEEHCSDILYAVSIKEDTSYLCLDFTSNHEDMKTNTPYLEDPIRCIEDKMWLIVTELPYLGEPIKNSSYPKHIHFINTITILSKEDEPRETRIVKPYTKDNDHDTIVKVEEEGEESEEEGKYDDSSEEELEEDESTVTGELGVIFDEEQLGSSQDFHMDDSWMTI
ncbi:hypothetical protein Tco_0401499 [Tanacetum coccineum]